MESFRWIVSALSMILGLGVTRLLSGLIEVFRSRRHATLDWIPPVWAACIFVAQLQFWWAIIELQHMVSVWTVQSFLLLISLPILLFASAALILPLQRLPPGESLRDAFEEDGQWALMALSAYMALTIVVNWHFWKLSPLSPQGALTMMLVVLPIAVISTRSRRVEAWVTIAYVVLYLISAAWESPAAYR